MVDCTIIDYASNGRVGERTSVIGETGFRVTVVTHRSIFILQNPPFFVFLYSWFKHINILSSNVSYFLFSFLRQWYIKRFSLLKMKIVEVLKGYKFMVEIKIDKL